MNILIFLNLYLISTIDICWGWWSNDATITIENKIRITGKEYSTPSGKKYGAFMGIPYAEPPTVDKRFKSPIMKNIADSLTAKKLGSECVQETEKGGITGNEDCLFLNVYVPWPKKDDQKLPVMFWVHGGSFNKGNGGWQYYGPDYLIEQDVIVVTINYRLGILGFLSAPDIGIHGNMGLKDQREALKWVNKYIDKFGGDKDRITIFGESAGAGSIHYLMMDSTTQNLYKRAILQSGSALNPWAYQFQPKERFENFTKALTLEGGAAADLSKLQSLTVDQIMEAAKKVPDSEDERRATKPVFNPVIEKDDFTDDPIVTQDILDLMQTKNKFPDKEVLMGFNSAEGLLAMDRVIKDKDEIKNTLKDVERVIPRDFHVWLDPNNEKVKTAIENLMKTYNNDKEEMKYIDLMGDAWFNYGVFKTLKSIINTNGRKENTYFYKLSDSSYSVYKKYVITKYSNLPGVCHADDLGYLFRMYGDSYGLYELKIPQEGVLTHKRLVKMWSNFAKTGNPLHEKANGGNTLEKKKDDDPLSKVTWEKVDKDNIKYLDITKEKELEMKQFQNVEGKRFDLWDKLYDIGQKIYKNKKPDTKL